MRRAGKIALWIAGGSVALVLAGFAVLQTGMGKGWLASALADALSSQTATISVGTIEGVAPFDMRIANIAIRDSDGPWLTIDQVAVAWSPSALLQGRLRIDRLTAGSIALLRRPQPSQASGPSGLALPRLPIAVELRTLSVARLIVAPAVAGGDDAEASLTAHGLLTRDLAALSVNLARTDGQPGAGSLEARYNHPANALTLKLDIDEPTGILIDSVLGRGDHLPLRITLDGAGPLSGWQGEFHLISGLGIHADAHLEIAKTAGTRIAVNGAAAIAPLLVDDLRPSAGNALTFDIVAAGDGKGGMMLAPSRISLGAVTIAAQGHQSDRGLLDGNLHIVLPDISVANPLLGQPATGAISVDAVLSGTTDRPKMMVTQHGDITVGDIAVGGFTVAANIDGKPGRTADDPGFDITLDANAENLRNLGDQRAYGPLSLHIVGTTDARGAQIDVGTLTVTGGGVKLQGVGGVRGGIAQGAASLKATDLSVVGGLFGQHLGGAANIDIRIKTDRQRAISLELSGKGEGLRSGTRFGDALLAGETTLKIAGTRASTGKIGLDTLALETGRVKIEGNGAFDPADRSIGGSLTARLANLAGLSPSPAVPLNGGGRLFGTIGGTLDDPTIDAEASFDAVAIDAARIDRFTATLHAPHGLAGVAALKGRIESGKLVEAIDADLSRDGPDAYRLNRLHMTGTGGAIDAAMTIDPSASRFAGDAHADIPDLSIWSGLSGRALGGRISLALDIPADGARQGPVKATIERFSLGSGPNAIAIAHAALAGELSGDIARRTGAFDLSLNGVAATGGTITSADAHVSSKGKIADFRLRATGRAHDPASIALAGSITEDAGGNAARIASLAVKIGNDAISLTKPLSISIAPNSYAMTGLAMSVDGGSIEGDAALSTKAVTADLNIRQLPLHPLAALAGKDFVGGTLNGRLVLSGSPQKPVGNITLATKGLDIQTDGPLPRPSLGLNASADWRGDRVGVDAKITSGTGESLALTGSAPFAFDLATLAPKVTRDAGLNLTLKGGGRLENLSAIVPLGEDRIAGAFTVDLAVGGTVAAPRPSGHVAITGGRYANMALGTELDGIDLALTTAGERLILDHLTATDAKSGQLSASGALDLGHMPAAVGFDLNLKDFLVARGDDMTVAADGDLKLAGTLNAMTVSGALTVVNAELYIPDRLPANIVTLDVVEVGGRDKAEATKAAPVAPVALRIALDAPGQIFVRGHGVTSQWRGHLDVAGSTAAPSVAGQLTVDTGSIDLLGQSFTIDRGIVSFGGGTTIDPLLNIQASAAATSVTALVNVTGTARAPKIALSSTPVMPQDEILSRLLFGANVGSLTTSQGLQLAAAAATLAQGGPGILDRVRSKIGLDRLDLGSGGANPNGTQGVAKGTTVSGGKYVANGVFVGVAQGLGSNSSQAKVEVEITPNISVNSTFGTSSGSGFGAKYSVDY